jgi:hypothetical protein
MREWLAFRDLHGESSSGLESIRPSGVIITVVGRLGSFTARISNSTAAEEAKIFERLRIRKTGTDPIVKLVYSFNGPGKSAHRTQKRRCI